jgi:hypothetical protein
LRGAEEPRFFTGTATAHAVSGLQIRALTLDVVLERVSANKSQTITTVDDPGVTETLFCLETKLTEAGASLVSCDDGSFGTKVDPGSSSARRIVQTDGSINVSGSAVDDGGERRRKGLPAARRRIGQEYQLSSTSCTSAIGAASPARGPSFRMRR